MSGRAGLTDQIFLSYIFSVGPSQAPAEVMIAQVLLLVPMEMNMGKSPELKVSIPSSNPDTPQDGRGIVLLGACSLNMILTPDICLAALEETYACLHAAPDDRGQLLSFKTADGKFHVKAGLSPRSHTYFAAKVNANFPANQGRFSLPTIQGLIVLCAGVDGRPVAVLQSGTLTALRTAAATGLAAKHGARPNSHTLTIIGCGMQARYQAQAMFDLFPIRELMMFDNDENRARAFGAWAEDEFAVTATVTNSPGDAVRTSDICITCTTSARAIVEPHMVPEGCFVAAVGADNPDKLEIDPLIFANARIIVDDLEQCAAEGDLAHALRAGVVQIDNVSATLAQLAAGARQGRTRDDEIVLFDSTGSGVQDVAVAGVAYEIASRRHIGEFCALDQ